MAALTATRVNPTLRACYQRPHRGRQAAQGGPRRLHAQAARPLQRALQIPDHLGPDHGLTLDAPTQLLCGHYT